MSKAIKYFFALVSFVIAFFIAGELHYESLFSFQNRYAETSVYLQNGQNQNNLCTDIAVSAERYHVSVFAIESKATESDKILITIYCTDGTQKIIAKQSDICDGVYASFFAESACVEFIPIAYLPENENGIILHIIGDWENICLFKASLVDTYAGKYPSKGVNDVNLYILYGVWTIAFSVLLVFTIFEIFSFEKEKTILVVNGRSISSLMLRKILTDSLALSGIYMAAYVISAQLCYSDYHIKDVSLLFLLFLIGNALCYLLMLKFDVKKGFSNVMTNKPLLCFLGIYKGIVCVCIITIFSLSIHSLGECVSFLRQKDFFQKNQYLSYVTFVGKQNQSSESTLIEYSDHYYALCKQFYQNHQDNTVILDYISEIDGFCIMNMNSAALEQFSDDIKLADKSINLFELRKESTPVVFIPKQFSEQSKDSIIRLISNKEDIMFIEYEQFKTVCIGSDRNYISSYETDPIVILNDSYSSPRTVLYRVSEKECEDFLKSYSNAVEQWEYRIDNAAEMYNIYKANIENMLALYLGLMLILVILAVMTIITITKLYFISHKIEFAVKYCLGDNFVQFLSMPLRINLTILLVSSICAWLISVIFKLNISKDLIFGSLIIVLIDFISLYVLYLNFIRKNIIQILKGRAI